MGRTASLFFYIIAFVTSAMTITKVGNLYKRENIKNKKAKIAILTIIGLGIPILIASLRYYVGTDYGNYITIYNNRKDLTFVELITSNWELLFMLVIKIASILNDYQYMFGIIAMLTIIVIYASIYNYKEKLSLGFMFFLYLFLHFATSFNIIRQALAVVIIAYSYKFILNRDLKKFIITVVIASFFHITALIFLPFYLVWDKKVTFRRKAIQIIFIIITMLIVINYKFFINLLSDFSIFERFEMYSTEKDSNNLEFLLNVIILCIVLLFRKMLIKYDDRNELFIYLYTISVILMFTGYFSPFLKRIAMYFGISNIFIFATFPQIAKNNKQKLLIYFLLTIYAISIFTITTYILKQANIIPYNSILER